MPPFTLSLQMPEFRVFVCFYLYGFFYSLQRFLPIVAKEPFVKLKNRSSNIKLSHMTLLFQTDILIFPFAGIFRKRECSWFYSSNRGGGASFSWKWSVPVWLPIRSPVFSLLCESSDRMDSCPEETNITTNTPAFPTHFSSDTWQYNQ